MGPQTVSRYTTQRHLAKSALSRHAWHRGEVPLRWHPKKIFSQRDTPLVGRTDAKNTVTGRPLCQRPTGSTMIDCLFSWGRVCLVWDFDFGCSSSFRPYGRTSETAAVFTNKKTPHIGSSDRRSVRRTTREANLWSRRVGSHPQVSFFTPSNGRAGHEKRDRSEAPRLVRGKRGRRFAGARTARDWMGGREEKRHATGSSRAAPRAPENDDPAIGQARFLPVHRKARPLDVPLITPH